ncbi:hypothetical protein, partial [Paraclostridium bifermentans]|uniref:hypothetical protein n=1 Tax=Paraclostridium bifermentans TaxID=1490 RepID=UPI00242DAA51
AEVFKEVVINNLQIDKIKLYYTTDLRQNEESLVKSLVEFKLNAETNKYKMENLELNLLG